MSEKALKNVERFASALEKIGDVLEKLPRLIEMGAVSYFAGKASVRVGGSFEMGALGGAAADGLAHSQLPNNQIGGIALAAYFAAIGFFNILPAGKPTLPPVVDDSELPPGAGGTVLDPDNIWSGLESTEKVVPFDECVPFGGTVVRPIPKTNLVVCRFPPPPPIGVEGPIGGIRR